MSLLSTSYYNLLWQGSIFLILAFTMQLLFRATKPPEEEPRLGRVDLQPLGAKDLDKRRFGITIESVYYYFESGRCCCAILLKTSFLLGNREILGRKCYFTATDIH